MSTTKSSENVPVVPPKVPPEKAVAVTVPLFIVALPSVNVTPCISVEDNIFPVTSRASVGASLLTPTLFSDTSTNKVFDALTPVLTNKSSDNVTLFAIKSPAVSVAVPSVNVTPCISVEDNIFPVTSRASVGAPLLTPTLSLVASTYKVSVSNTALAVTEVTPASFTISREMPSEDLIATLSVPPEPCNIVVSDVLTDNTTWGVPPLFLNCNSSVFCKRVSPFISKETAADGVSVLIPTEVAEVSTKRTLDTAPLIIKSSDINVLPTTSRVSDGVAVLIPTLLVALSTTKSSVLTFKSAEIFVSPTISNFTVGVDVPIPTLLVVVSTTISVLLTSTLPVKVIRSFIKLWVIEFKRSAASLVCLLQTSNVCSISVFETFTPSVTIIYLPVVLKVI